MAFIDKLFHRMVAAEASDMHLTSGRKPVFRIHGEMVTVDECGEITAEQMRELLFEITPKANQEEFDACSDTDFAYEIEGLARFRANIFMDNRGPGAVFRQIPSEILTAEQLGLPDAVMDLCSLSKGLVLVTGPTGSGKSTTLAAMIDQINKSRTDHIITIEDPIEFVHKDQRCLVNQREVGSHTGSFKKALRAALREDPDVVLVGELRDLETIEIAIETAETGHLVFGTLHTTTAPSTVDRIIDQFPAGQQAQIRTMLAGSLKGVVAQTLCKKQPKGRVAALEILVVNNPVAAQIRDGKVHQIVNSMQTGGKYGMRLLNDSLVDLVQQGLVAPAEAYTKAVEREDLLQKFGNRGISFDPSQIEQAPPAPAAPAAAPPAAALPGQAPMGAPAPAPIPGEPSAPLPGQMPESQPAPAPAPQQQAPGDDAGGFNDPFDEFKKTRRAY